MNLGILVVSECGAINDDTESLRARHCRNIARKAEATHSLPTGEQFRLLDGCGLIDSVEKTKDLDRPCPPS
ncbi:hypothetical protein [Mesorhizobium sp. M8A.F.Ca.ET.165.01.1.1]|uniref:hypothetical protein n=1 Tax=Mesorhizobium sp. M8A.F.Ca.ET.165.01.1.1 TaxID=2563960 RepID=UPI0010934411|nr:hypothetical protein [Mesorhizobium sp. M8A.F.Ca.ET.165.01.1.1]TGT42423.1 hypothetical protein EN808_11000 [Mesorhizobium sp. M8A.F.Ca.ET.165.01.1.1]